jgi:hypothetical protein
MAEHRIICTRKDSFDMPHLHSHVMIVGTEKSAGYSKLWTVTQVYNAMDQGESFYTHGDTSGKRALVHKYQCPHCSQNTLQSAPDAVTDNNLDSLSTRQ